jgi:hypothetical protein
VCLALALALRPVAARAQFVEPNNVPPTSMAVTLDVVIARYTGEKADKKVSSVPYSLALTARSGSSGNAPPTSLRLGNKVPIPATVFNAAGDAKASPAPITAFTYQDMGINIDARAGIRPDGRFEVFLTMNETSVASPRDVQGLPSVGSGAVIRSFQLNDTVILRDGETRQFTSATDRVTGETVKIDVTIKTVK